MRAGLIASCLLAGTATGCAPDPPTAVTRISYATTPCFGGCPVYQVVVGADGNGRFEGRRYTAVAGLRAFKVTPEQFRAFAAQLEPLRPASGERRLDDPSLCDPWATDHPTIDVTWTVGEATQRLRYNMGCAAETHRDIAARLTSAPEILPIAEMIGQR